MNFRCALKLCKIVDKCIIEQREKIRKREKNFQYCLTRLWNNDSFASSSFSLSFLFYFLSLEALKPMERFINAPLKQMSSLLFFVLVQLLPFLPFNRVVNKSHVTSDTKNVTNVKNKIYCNLFISNNKLR